MPPRIAFAAWARLGTCVRKRQRATAKTASPHKEGKRFSFLHRPLSFTLRSLADFGVELMLATAHNLFKRAVDFLFGHRVVLVRAGAWRTPQIFCLCQASHRDRRQRAPPFPAKNRRRGGWRPARGRWAALHPDETRRRGRRRGKRGSGSMAVTGVASASTAARLISAKQARAGASERLERRGVQLAKRCDDRIAMAQRRAAAGMIVRIRARFQRALDAQHAQNFFYGAAHAVKILSRPICGQRGHERFHGQFACGAVL